MLLGVVLLLLLLLVDSWCSPQTLSSQCQCSTLPAAKLKVDCTGHSLRKAPIQIPVYTAELHLHGNLLASVPAGYFDLLPNLRMANLSGNPFHCDCRIEYLRSWLLKNKALVPELPTCSSPHSLRGKVITELDDSLFSPCDKGHGSPCSVYNVMLGFMLCALNVALFWSLKLAKDSPYILGIYEKHTGFEASSLRSRKPKHKTRPSLGFLNETERPILNMDILPQIMDTLQRKHNIKLKEV